MVASADLAQSSKDAMLLRAIVHWSKLSRPRSTQGDQAFDVGCLRKGCAPDMQSSLQSKPEVPSLRDLVSDEVR